MNPITIEPVAVRNLTLQYLHDHNGVWIMFDQTGKIAFCKKSCNSWDILRELSEYIDFYAIPVPGAISVPTEPRCED